jgi:hypothetical protein
MAFYDGSPEFVNRRGKKSLHNITKKPPTEKGRRFSGLNINLGIELFSR